VHSLFLDQLEALVEAVEAARAQDPIGYARKNDTKRRVAILELAFDVILQDPARPVYHQGDTLGAQHKHWFRAKLPPLLPLQQARPHHRDHLG